VQYKSNGTTDKKQWQAGDLDAALAACLQDQRANDE
jgi:hypothetical protein